MGRDGRNGGILPHDLKTMGSGAGVPNIDTDRATLLYSEDRAGNGRGLTSVAEGVHRHSAAVDQFDINIDDLEVEVRCLAGRNFLGNLG